MSSFRILLFGLLSAFALAACDGSGSRSGGGAGPGNGNGDDNGGDPTDPVQTLLEGSLFLPPQTIAGPLERTTQRIAGWLLSPATADSRIDLLASAAIPDGARLYVIRLASDVGPVDITSATTFNGSLFSIDVDEALELLEGSDAFGDLDTLTASRLALRLDLGGSTLDAPLAPDADGHVHVSPVTELLARELDLQATASEDADGFFAGLDAEELAGARETFILGIVAAVQDQNITVDFGNLETARETLAEAGVTNRLNQDLVLAAVESAPAGTADALAGRYNLVRLGVSLLSNSDGSGAIEHYATLADFNLFTTHGGLGFELASGEQQDVGQEAFGSDYRLDFIRYEVIEFEDGEDAIGGTALAGADGTLTLARDEFHQEVTRNEPAFERFDEYFHANTSRGAFHAGSGLIYFSDRESSHQRCIEGACADLSLFGTVGLMVGAPVLEQAFVPSAADGRYGMALLQSSVENTGQRIIAAVDINFDAGNGLATEFSGTRIAYERGLPFALERDFESLDGEPGLIAFTTPKFDAKSPLGNGAFELDLFEGETLLRGFVLDGDASAFVGITAAVCLDADDARVECEANEDGILEDGLRFANRIDRDGGGFEYEQTLALGLRLPAALESLDGGYRVRGIGLNYDGDRNDLLALNGGTIRFEDGTVTLGTLRSEEVLRDGDTNVARYRELPIPRTSGSLELDAANPGRFSFSLSDDDDGFLDAAGYVSHDGELIVISLSSRPKDLDFDHDGPIAPFHPDRGEAFGGAFVLIGSRIDYSRID